MTAGGGFPMNHPRIFKILPRMGAVATLAVAALFVMPSCASAPRDVRVAHVEDHQIAYRVLGSGRPVIVMISGLGDGMTTFDDAAAELAQSATVIVYDRAGYGGSDAVEGARDARAAERELSALLEQSGVNGPYVLLGHSVGGLYAEYYAAQHPHQVAGLILEDSRPSNFSRACEGAGVDMCAMLSSMAWTLPAGARGELAALVTTERQVGAISPISGKPVLVLSRPVASNANAFDATWASSQRELANRYGARHLTAPTGGHYVHGDEAAWFVSSIQSFLESDNATR
jgi:pimeloyl-ACP methyl ester carboxylesterase